MLLANGITETMTDRAKLIEELRYPPMKRVDLGRDAQGGPYFRTDPDINAWRNEMQIAAAQIEAGGRLEAENERLRKALAEIYRVCLVIESAVRNADPFNLDDVLVALKANSAALSTTTPDPPGCPTPGACSCREAQVSHLARMIDTVRSIPDQELSESVCREIDAAFNVNPQAYSFWSGMALAFDECRARGWYSDDVAARLPDMPFVDPQRNEDGTAVSDIVSGRLAWRGNGCWIGKIHVGYVDRWPQGGSWRATSIVHGHVDYRGNHSAESEARAAVERAVRDAIGGNPVETESKL